MRTEKEIREAFEKFESVEYDYNLMALTDVSKGFKEALRWVLQDTEYKGTYEDTETIASVKGTFGENYQKL